MLRFYFFEVKSPPGYKKTGITEKISINYIDICFYFFEVKSGNKKSVIT